MRSLQPTLRSIVPAFAAVLMLAAGGALSATTTGAAHTSSMSAQSCNPYRGCLPGPCGGHQCLQ